MQENIKEVVAEWRGGMAFEGKNSSGGRVQVGEFDGKPGIRPMELLLVGLAGCTGVDIVNILEKKRQKLSDFTVRVRGERAETHPKVYTKIRVEYYLWGEGLEPRAVEQAIQLSEDKYCSARAMLGAVAKITSQYHILAPGEALPEEEQSSAEGK